MNVSPSIFVYLAQGNNFSRPACLIAPLGSSTGINWPNGP